MKQLEGVGNIREASLKGMARIGLVVLLCGVLSGCFQEPPPPPPPPKTDWVTTVALVVASGITCLFIGMLMMARTNRAARGGRGRNELVTWEEK